MTRDLTYIRVQCIPLYIRVPPYIRVCSIALYISVPLYIRVYRVPPVRLKGMEAQRYVQATQRIHGLD